MTYACGGQRRAGCHRRKATTYRSGRAQERFPKKRAGPRAEEPASTGRPAAEASGDASSSSFVRDFLATSEGLDLVRAFTCIEDAKLRRAIVRLVEQIAPDDA
jgi:hypothetical protein